MVAITSFVAASASLLALTSAAPTERRNYPAGQEPQKRDYHQGDGIIHRVYAGSKSTDDPKNGFRFFPENILAEPGDFVEFHFLPKNHTVVQSSFDKPCEPLDGGFFSGFNFATNETEAKDVFTIQIKDRKPIWYYCSQPTADPNTQHCKSGMSGVINQAYDTDKTLLAYKEKAKNAQVKQPSTDKTKSQGGNIMKNVFILGDGGKNGDGYSNGQPQDQPQGQGNGAYSTSASSSAYTSSAAATSTSSGYAAAQTTGGYKNY